MDKFLSLIFILFFTVTIGFSQSGEIQGRVTDADSGEGIPFANVTTTVAGALTGAQTDFDGYYSIKPIAPGTYDVKVSYIGYQANITQGVIVNADKITFLDIGMGGASEILDEVVIVEYKVPLIKQDETSTGATVTKEDIDNLPTRNVNSIASSSAGVYQSDEGEDINVKGARSEATDYYIDGIKVRGSSAIPTQSIEQISVLTGGLPAKYGDATGGVINITTRGPSNQFSGGVEVLTSQFLDPYGYNLATASVSGPLVKVNKGTDMERPILGFFIAGEYLREKDDEPSAIGVPVVKESVLDSLRQFPLVKEETLSGAIFKNRSEFLTNDDIEISKYKPNIAKDQIGATAKIDFQPVRGINFTLGGTYNFAQRNRWFDTYTLMNSDNNGERIDQTYRGYVRFTQRFGASALDLAEEETEPSLFSNAYYSVQFDYTKDFETFQDERHEDRLFDYAYVGKFETFRAPAFSADRFDELSDGEFDFHVILNDFSDTAVVYTPGELNPYMANHTQQYYDLAGDDSDFYFTTGAITANGGLINGARSVSTQSAYSIWYNAGRVTNQYLKAEDDQYRLSFNGSVDMKRKGKSARNKHAIEFGFEYEQRVDREYDTRPADLWNRARLSANSHLGSITEDAQGRPALFVLLNSETGVPYTFQDGFSGNIDFNNIDSVSVYDYQNENNFLDLNDLLAYEYGAVTDPTFFGRSIRNSLGLGSNDYVDIDAVDPATLNLDLFSPLELFDSGILDNYHGYNYKGEKYTSQPAFEDFFTNRDENGNLTFDMPAFRPIYTAAYIQDKFAFEDLVFNVGLRLDRYDANQKVLKDKYSLYGIRTVDEMQNFTHPGNVGSDWAVYGDDPINPSNIIAYRDGDDWYNSLGEFVNPTTLASNSPIPVTAATSQGQLNIQSPDYDPSISFKDYEPQLSLMPRLSFSFNMSENAQFFAHYDQLVQRPQARLVASAADYYFLAENQTTQINNPDLKPEKTIDYQIGFRQRLSKSSALTIAGFYREIKDMIQFASIPFAYPRIYTTWLNQDFGTVKGLELTYDLRRTGNIKLYTTYTLQFAEGTGSDDISGFNLVDAGQPNLRTIIPLDYDSRHMIVTNIDFRFKDGSKYNGPKLFGSDIFSNAGINATIRARSGEPYSRTVGSSPEAIIGRRSGSALDGSINGSRLPWNVKADLKVDKDFIWKTGGKDGGTQRENAFNIYLQVQNLFNTLNVLGVYPFTGIPSDDGYLQSTPGIIETNLSTDSQSFVDLYNQRVDDPDNYTRPRTIRLGAAFSF